MDEGDRVGKEIREKGAAIDFSSFDQIAFSFKVIPILFNNPPWRD